MAKLNENRAKAAIKTWARACTIIPEFVGHTFEVHNGNKFISACTCRKTWSDTSSASFPRPGSSAATAVRRRVPPNTTDCRSQTNGRVEPDSEVTMPFEAKHSFARISPRKVPSADGPGARPGRGRCDHAACGSASSGRAGSSIEKVIRSAVANASEQSVAPVRNTLYVTEARVDAGPVIKRFQPKDRGKAYPINKRTSHLVVSIDERDEIGQLIRGLVVRR